MPLLNQKTALRRRATKNFLANVAYSKVQFVIKLGSCLYQSVLMYTRTNCSHLIQKRFSSVDKNHFHKSKFRILLDCCAVDKKLTRYLIDVFTKIENTSCVVLLYTRISFET